MREVVIDCMYEACPIPLLKVVKEMEKNGIGDKITIQTDHTCAIVNIEEWVEKEGHYCEVKEIGIGEWEISIEESRGTT